MSDAEGRLDDARMYGSLRERRGDGYEDAQDEAARERAEAVEERMMEILQASVSGIMGYRRCPECDETVYNIPVHLLAHLRDCELLRARAESEVDAAERAR